MMNAQQGYEEKDKGKNPIIGLIITFIMGAVVIAVMAGITSLAIWLYSFHVEIIYGILLIFLCFTVGGIVRIFLD